MSVTDHYIETLLQQLDKEYGAVRITQLTEVVRRADRDIQTAVLQALAAWLQVRYTTTVNWVEDEDCAGFLYRDAPHRVCVKPSYLAANELGVSVAPVVPDVPPPPGNHVSLSGPGTYSSIHVVLHGPFSKHQQTIERICVAVLQAGYAWIESLVRRRLSEMESDLAAKLYARIHAAFAAYPKHGLVRYIWVSALSAAGGFYPLDHASVERTFRLIENNRDSVTTSPATLVSHVLTSRLPFDKTFAKTAIAEGIVRRVDLSKSDYVSEHPDFEVSEELMFGGKRIAIYPVVRTGRHFLVIGLPAHLEDEIMEVLEPHLAAIADIFNEDRRAIQAVIRKFTTGSWALPVAQWLGTFWGAFWKQVHSP